MIHVTCLNHHRRKQIIAEEENIDHHRSLIETEMVISERSRFAAATRATTPSTTG
jgi:hypothetical protein